jgi:hypothetical protein
VRLELRRRLRRRFDVVRVCRPVARSLAGRKLSDGAERTDELVPCRLAGRPPRQRGSKGLDARRDIRQRVELPDQARYFFLGAMFGAAQDFAQVFLGKVRTKHQEAGEVELARSDCVQKSGEAADEASRGHAAKGLVLVEA